MSIYVLDIVRYLALCSESLLAEPRLAVMPGLIEKPGKESVTMSRMKSFLGVLLGAVIVSIAPQAQSTTTPEVVIVGASAEWQTLALAANSLAGAGAGHWTSASNVINVTDSRVNPVNVDAGTLWIVWNAAATKVWAFAKVDSIVGVRCYFAQPQCSVNGTLSALSGSGSNQISSAFWGADSTLPSNVQA